jgi:hypothetical protein
MGLWKAADQESVRSCWGRPDYICTEAEAGTRQNESSWLWHCPNQTDSVNLKCCLKMSLVAIRVGMQEALRGQRGRMHR